MTPLLHASFYLFTHCADLNYELTLNGMPISSNPRESFSINKIREINLNSWLFEENNLLKISTFGGAEAGFCRFEIRKRVQGKTEFTTLATGDSKGYSNLAEGKKVVEFNIHIGKDEHTKIIKAQREVIKNAKAEAFSKDWEMLMTEFMTAAKEKNRKRLTELLEPAINLQGQHLGLPEKWTRAKLNSDLDELLKADKVEHTHDVPKMSFHRLKTLPDLYGLSLPIRFERWNTTHNLRLWLGEAERGYFIKFMDIEL